MSVLILDTDSIEIGRTREVARVEPNGELYLPLDLLYMRMSPRLFITTNQ